MGSCISKCRPKKNHQQESIHVQDKLVISQAPLSPIPPSFKKPLSPSPSPTTSTSSISSFSCTNHSSISSTSSLTLSSSCSSSISCSKDRSFSNEFLWSCAKENPHIVNQEPIKGNLEKPVIKRVCAQTFDAPVKQSTPQKRARPISPTLTRQKSFRKEPERPSKALRSPSPSRRFDGESYNYSRVSTNTGKMSHCKNSVSSKEYVTNSVRKENLRPPSPNSNYYLSSKGNVGDFVRKENLRPASPIKNLSRHEGYLRSRETYTHQIGSKADEIGVGEVVSNSNDLVDSIPMEDIDNPLIALDCFIFL